MSTNTETEYSSTRVVTFLESLDDEERQLVFAMMLNQLPAHGAVSSGALINMRHEIFEALLKGDHIAIYKKVAHQTSRGIGTLVTHPDTKQQVQVRQETWRIGPRGRWYDVWEPVMNRLHEKIESF